MRRKSKKHILIYAQRNFLFVFVSSIRMRTTQSLDECAIKINQLGFGPGRAILCLSPTLRETIISNLLIWNCFAATEYSISCIQSQVCRFQWKCVCDDANSNSIASKKPRLRISIYSLSLANWKRRRTATNNNQTQNRTTSAKFSLDMVVFDVYGLVDHKRVR